MLSEKEDRKDEIAAHARLCTHAHVGDVDGPALGLH